VAAAGMVPVSRSYFMTNVKAEAYVWKQMLSVMVSADNVFDAQYADVLGAQMPGRWLSGGLKFNFSK
jgi:vitamin B12 transporter